MNTTKTIAAIAIAINLWLAPAAWSQDITYWPIAKIGGDTPQKENKPSNAIDGDLSTRWSAAWKYDTAPPSLVIDLGENRAFNVVEITWYEGSTREYYFNIEVFYPTWGFLAIGGGPSERMEVQSHPLGFVAGSRFIRIQGFGSDHPRAKTAEWTSISEIRIGYDPLQEDNDGWCIQ